MNIRRQTWSISDAEFRQFQELLLDITGISLAPTKRALVSSRLAKRLHYWELNSFGDYLKLINSGEHPEERQLTIDLLTTNETYFFREPRHFDFVRNHVLPGLSRGRAVRCWSAACSSGEEPYSLAMLFADVLGMEGGWELLGSDISHRMLVRARKGHYLLDRTHHIPPEYLSRFCLKGVNSQDGTFLVRPELRKRLMLRQINLNQALPSIGEFDLIFLRNVLIYFNPETKREVVTRIMGALRPGGYLIVGHSESLNGVVNGLETVKPSIYRRPGRPGRS
ncbi:MAG TPA: CheR family methyltransferase [Burkholderiaceae bacterium]|nr:CheR family methyltransferase [Burkholderiaceae bacterium]